MERGGGQKVHWFSGPRVLGFEFMALSVGSRFGTANAIRVRVGARTFTELHAWQLANELKLGVYKLIEAPDVRRDFEFRNQIRNAAASAPRNIAEGFGRFGPREFSQYLRVANGSLMETSNHLRDGHDRGYFREEDVRRLETLARRASAAVTALIRYLTKTKRAENPST